MADYGFPGGSVVGDRYQTKYGQPPPAQVLAQMPQGTANVPGDEPPTAAIGE